MIFGFYKFYLACLRYNFSFILDSEGYSCRRIEMVIKPNDEVWRVTITSESYRELFNEAILKMKNYRNSRYIK